MQLAPVKRQPPLRASRGWRVAHPNTTSSDDRAHQSSTSGSAVADLDATGHCVPGLMDLGMCLLAEGSKRPRTTGRR